MIRGAQKKMIVIRTHDSRVFEEAYFVMRREAEAEADDSDMMAEADRIIRKSHAGMHDDRKESRPHGQTRMRLRSVLWFFGGALLGSGCTCLIFMFL